MSKKQRPRSIRTFSESFKKSLVKEYTQGNFTVGQLCKLHQLHSTNVYEWIYKYGNIPKPERIIVEMKKSSTQKLKDYEEKIKELEQAVGQKQLLIDYYMRLVDLASDHYGEDIKKNLSTRPLKE